MKTLWTVVNNELKGKENIYILRQDEIPTAQGIMKEFTFDQIFNVYSGKEKVVRFWHEEGLCIIIR